MEMTAKKDYKIVSPNHFESLSSSNNDKDNFLSDQNTFAKIYAFVPKIYAFVPKKDWEIHILEPIHTKYH